MSETRRRVERGIKDGPAHGVVEDIEAPACRTCRNIVVDRRFLVVDERRAKLLDISLVLARTGGAHVGVQRPRELHDDMPDSACATVNKDLLPSANVGSIHEA